MSRSARCKPRRRHVSKGFTLIEMAVVVVVMALILGSILVPLSTQVEQRQVVETQRLLEDIKEALIGYALTRPQPYLPCPDKTSPGGEGTANDGLEDRVTAPGPTQGFCVSDEGNVPWATLGLGAVDPWGNRYRYRVTPAFARQLAPISLGTPGNLKVCAQFDCTQLLTVEPPSENSPVAVFLSHGPNGWGAVNAATSAENVKPASGTALGDDETANKNYTTTFISRARVSDDPSKNPSPEFDDIVAWLSPHTLKHRLVAAGKLP